MSWPEVSLKYVARLEYGDSVPQREEDRQGDVQVYGSNGPYAFNSAANTMAPVIIIGRKGSYGKVNWSAEAVFASDTTFFIDSRTTSSDLRWLYYVLQTLELDKGSDEAAVPGLNRDEAYQRTILLPPSQSQHAIATYLDQHTARLDDLIDAKQQLLALLAEKRQALITHAVTRGLDPAAPLCDSGVPWLGEIPAHWEITEVRRVVEHIEQGWSPQADEVEPAEDEWGVVKLNAVKNGTFDPSKAKTIPSELEVPSALAIKPGDFLVTRANTPELVGDVCHVHSTPPKLILSDLIYRLSIDTSKIDGDFLSYFLQSTIGRIQIESDARGSSASMVKISQNHVMSWLVPIPPLDEQAGMARYLNMQIAKFDALQVAAVATVELLHERRSALIAVAVTGQIDVTEPSCN
ncbi:MAG: restriction endonuclease subunit S [Caldilinea sp.]|nr:restriction endonuclease subunit S [Caldilinea sp.]